MKNSEKILIVKELQGEFYRIFYSAKDMKDKTLLYETPIESSVSNAVMKSLEEEYGLMLNKLQLECKNFSNEDVFINMEKGL